MRRAVLPLLFVLLAGAASGVSFSVTQQSDWDAGTFEDTESANGNLQVAGGQNSGNYTSQVFDAGDNYTWDAVETSSALNGGSATVTVETSRDDFTTVLGRATSGLSGTSESFNLSDLNETRYVRFNYSLNGDANISSTNVTIGDDSTFIIRSGACQSDETELFSLSGRTNAHAGDPDYWSHGVCASGFDERHYTQVCATADTPVLSFYGSEQATTHLSTDPDLFNYRLCTGALTIGVRDECPDTTKAIVSIFEEDEDHIAEPGHYSTQLCGAFFDSVTAMLEFSMGPNATVRINRTENPSQGVYSDTDGRDSWYITSENETVVTGIVSGERTTSTGVGYDERGNRTAFNLTQERGETGYLFPFAVGSAGDVENRISLIEGGNFIDQINPNFGFALAEELTVRLTLRLSGIDLRNDFELSPGVHQLIIENLGENSQGEPVVSVNATQ